MNYISMPAPIRFYQVREDSTTREELATKFNVHPNNIETEHADAEITKGQIVVIRTG